MMKVVKFRFLTIIGFLIQYLASSSHASNVTFFDFIGKNGVILAIGDGLSFGKVIHTKNGKDTVRHHPYYRTLELDLQTHSIKNRIMSENEDVELSTQLFYNTQNLIKSGPHLPYKAAIILAGHDEVLSNQRHSFAAETPNTIVHNIIHVHELFHTYSSSSKSHDRISFVVTLPGFKSTVDPKKDATRKEVNKLLRMFASDCSKRVFLVEASTLFTSSSGKSVSSKYFSDKNYLSDEGYDAIASKVYKKLESTSILPMTNSERLAYIDNCFSNAFPLFKNIKNGTILTIGDSLTYGESYTVSKDGKKIQIVAPYTGQLNNILNVSRSKSDTIIAIPRGVGGEGTTHMSIRIKKELQSFVDTSPPLKAVAILGGTVDVLKKRPAAETIKDIISMHETVLKFKPSTTTKEVEEEVANSDSNTNTNTYMNKNRLFSFAITLPPIDTVHGPKDINELRLELNEKIRNFASNCQDRVVLIDLESIYDQSYAEEEHNWSPDLLHFSPKGYSGVANSVHYCLLSYLDIQMTSNSKMTDEEFFSSCFPESNNGDK